MKTIKTEKTLWVCTSCENWCIRREEPRDYRCHIQKPYFQKTTLTFSTPLNKVLKTGQPVLVGDFKALRFFSHFDQKDRLHTLGSIPQHKTTTWIDLEWTLPTREELKKIGHADFGWLAAEDLDSDHSEE